MKKTGSIYRLIGIGLLGASLGVQADPYYRPHEARESAGSHGFYTYARVVEVEPLLRYVQVPDSYRECHEAPVTRYERYREPGSESYTPLILGGIVGGVVGNQFGKGSGRTALTVAGTLLGGSLGRDYREDHHRHVASRPYQGIEQRCEVHRSYHQEERDDGYRVSYRYQGQTFTTHTDHRPGRRIRVLVKVTPAES